MGEWCGPPISERHSSRLGGMADIFRLCFGISSALLRRMLPAGSMPASTVVMSWNFRRSPRTASGNVPRPHAWPPAPRSWGRTAPPVPRRSGGPAPESHPLWREGLDIVVEKNAAGPAGQVLGGYKALLGHHLFSCPLCHEFHLRKNLIWRVHIAGKHITPDLFADSQRNRPLLLDYYN